MLFLRDTHFCACFVFGDTFILTSSNSNAHDEFTIMTRTDGAKKAVNNLSLLPSTKRITVI